MTAGSGGSGVMSAWVRDPKAFIDRGRVLPEGPPLLKERRYLRKVRRAVVEFAPDRVEATEAMPGATAKNPKQRLLLPQQRLDS